MTIQSRYDVIIVGGGTAGCAAAYIAGLSGLKTLLIEKSIHLGGTMTSGLVVPAMNSSSNQKTTKQINNEFFDALINETQQLNAQATYQGNPGWFNPELCKVALDRLMTKANVDVLFDTRVLGVNIVNKEINGLTISSNMLSVYIAANYIVDTTGNCEISALAGCDFLQKNEEVQPVSLRFEMAGINIKQFRDWLLDYDSDRNVTSSEIINGQVHLSTAYTWDSNKKWALALLFEDAVANNVLKDEDRSYFQIFTIPNMPNSMAFNCPRVYSEPNFGREIDPLDNTQTSKALVIAREAIVRLANFCKIYLPGFEKSYISNIADTLGVRVSRRIKGKYVYTTEDLKSGKTFDNPVLISSYPIDVHSNKNGESILEHTVQEYQLPLESLMSYNYDNLFVAGRCLSADFHAQAALRIQPSCFSMGEGVARHIVTLINNKD